MPQPSLQDDSHTDYRRYRRQALDSLVDGVWPGRFGEGRFVAPEERRMVTDMPAKALELMDAGKRYYTYRGAPLAKDPLDKALYEVLFYEVKPRTIFEFGSYTGASAMWMADTLATFGVKARVYSIDIDLGLLAPQAREHPGVSFLQGDCNAIEQTLTPELLAGAERPWIAIDDAHVNTDGVLEHLHVSGMAPGDYVVLEDTYPEMPTAFGPEEKNEGQWGDWKWRSVEPFLQRHRGEYLVDRYYTDFFGYNGTWNFNGFLKRMEMRP